MHCSKRLLNKKTVLHSIYKVISLHCVLTIMKYCCKQNEIARVPPSLIEFSFNSSVWRTLHFTGFFASNFPGFFDGRPHAVFEKWHPLFHPRELSRCITGVDLSASLSLFFKIRDNAITANIYRLFLQADARKRFALPRRIAWRACSLSHLNA